MPNVFATNKTSSSITVAGHKTYYIDSADAEIVEVEGQGGGGSTASDDATGTISALTLPSAHSYTGVSFDSLRYYAKGTLSNTGQRQSAYGIPNTFFYGTITWEDSSLGDLTDKIATNSPDNGYTVKQTVFRIIFINYDSISGYHPWDDGDDSGLANNNQISDYSYNNGVHSITFWMDSVDWTGGFVYPGRIQFRYLDGTTTFNNLSAFDLVNVSGGSLSKDTTTDRYDMYNVWGGDITLHALYGSGETIRRNAFKYLLSGTPYWYVIDGEHDTWTDDLSAWGYTEIQPAPVLPEVNTTNDIYHRFRFNKSGSDYTFSARGTTSVYSDSSTNPTYVDWDTTKVYGVIKYYNSDQTFVGRQGITPIEAPSWGEAGKVYMKNNSGDSLTVAKIRVATCDDLSCTVVTVYNSSNVAYNAFKYTANNTDYYYVLDGTQTDWTDDLAGIGYSLTPETVVAYLDSNKTAITMQSGNTTYLKDASGYALYYDSTKTYSAYRYYSSSSDTTGTDATGIRIGYLSGWSYLMIENNTGSTITIQRIEYTVS